MLNTEMILSRSGDLIFILYFVKYKFLLIRLDNHIIM